MRAGFSGDGVHTLRADSTSGTGIQVAGVSGAVAATLALGSSNAFIGNGATLTLTNGGDLTVQAGASLDNTANAVPLVDAGTTLGVGASFELNAGIFRTIAEIQDASIVGADDVSVTANGTYLSVADAHAGVSADSGVGAAVAALISNNTTTADLTNSTTTSTITGDLTVTANHTAHATHAAAATTAAADVGVGAALAIGVMQGGAQAFVGNSMNVGGAVTVSAVTTTTMNADATASSAGTASDDLLLAFKMDMILEKAFEALRPAFDVDPITAVNGVADTITLTGHGLATGDTLVYSKGQDDETIGSLVDGTSYFVRVIDANTIKLYGSLADAQNNANALNLEPTTDVDNQHKLQPGVPASVRNLITTSRLGTADGAVGAAAAVAANLDFNSAFLGITTGANITSTGAVHVTSTMDSDVDASADASAVDSATALGIAAAANMTSQSNQAFIGGRVSAPSIEVHALLGGNGIADFTAHATSGGEETPRISVWPARSRSI